LVWVQARLPACFERRPGRRRACHHVRTQLLQQTNTTKRGNEKTGTPPRKGSRNRKSGFIKTEMIIKRQKKEEKLPERKKAGRSHTSREYDAR